MISEREYMRTPVVYETEVLPAPSGLVKHQCFRCNKVGIPSTGYDYDYEIVKKTDFNWPLFILLGIFTLGLIIFFCWTTTTYTVPRKKETFHCRHCGVEWNARAVLMNSRLNVT